MSDCFDLTIIDQLRADLSRVTAERDEARAAHCAELANMAQMHAVENAAIRDRVAELEQKAADWKAASICYEQDAHIEAARARQAEQRNAELVAALRAIRDLDDDATAEDCAARAGSAPASAESVTPATVKDSLTVEPKQEPCGGRCGDPECDLDTNGVTMRAPAPHPDTAETEAVRRELEKWKKAHETVSDERAASFAMLAKAVGGCALTEYQPEIDMEIEAGIKALRRDKERLDWLDEVNQQINRKHGTVYGYRCDVNHNRAEVSLNDSRIPALTVRAAIDAARHRAKQEARK